MNEKAKDIPRNDQGARIHFKKDGEPFATRKAAVLRMGVLRNNGIYTVPIELDDGGWALQEVPRPDQKRQFDMIQRNILTAPKREGYQRRFVNDVGDRVEQFLANGWNVVTDETIQVGDERVGKSQPIGSPITKDVGVGVTAVLMEIPQELYDARQKRKSEIIAEKERKMALQNRAEGAYGNVKISDSASPHRQR